jgi:hypothetical protein
MDGVPHSHQKLHDELEQLLPELRALCAQTAAH